MTTLFSKPVSTLLDRLFSEAEASLPLRNSPLAALPSGERERLLRSKTEYRSLYAGLKDFPLPVSRETGRLLYQLVHSSRAKTIIEFGTSFGISTLHLAAALRDNGGGRLITTEFEPTKLARARENLTAAGLVDLVEFREGDALQTLASDLPAAIDLVLLDGAKGLYPEILRLLESRLRSGALIVADNADASPEYMALVCSPDQGYLSVSFAEDVELSLRLG